MVATDLNLHVWNYDGAHAGPENTGFKNEILGGTHLGDAMPYQTTNGLEEYTDSLGDSHLLTLGA